MPRWVSMASFAAAVIALTGCEHVAYYSQGGDSTSESGVDPDRKKALGGVAACAFSLYEDFWSASTTLSGAAAAFEETPNDETRAAVQAAWTNAIAIWQQAELIGVGAAAPMGAPGGEGLRDQVYSWPLVSRCLVEQTLVSQAYAEPSFHETALVNQRGLAALEYLLFYPGSDNACSATSGINKDGTWAALSAEELGSRKRAYAAVSAQDMLVPVQGIDYGWSPARFRFMYTLATAGEPGSDLDSQVGAVRAVTHGLLHYLETQVRDGKLGHPLGLVDCATSTCPEAIESPYAGQSRDHVRNNLLGAQRLFEGCDASGGVGLAVVLEASGDGDIADAVHADLVAALAAADAIGDPSLGPALAEDPEKVKALYDAVSALTTTLAEDAIPILDSDPGAGEIK